MKPVIVITGQTCSGKTELSIKLAKALNTEIISADSRQIYKLLSIGTAKPNAAHLNEIKHHFIDEIFPDEDFNADLFRKQALKIISDITNRDLIPIVVGGSGLYIKALIEGLDVRVDANMELRKSLMEKREKYGNEFIHQELKMVDPTTANKLLPQNWKRVIRALEVFYTTQKPIWQKSSEKQISNFDFIQYGLLWNRHTLYERINQRVEQMIQDGLLEETKKILELGYDRKLNSLNTVGYKEMIDFIEGKISFEKAIYLIKRNTRRFAKKQMTWFRKNKNIIWLDAENSTTDELTEKILKDIYERKN
jgi:tRNA dimethylallyltransferase